jgi:hypothetical protein
VFIPGPEQERGKGNWTFFFCMAVLGITSSGLVLVGLGGARAGADEDGEEDVVVWARSRRGRGWSSPVCRNTARATCFLCGRDIHVEGPHGGVAGGVSSDRGIAGDRARRCRARYGAG